MSKLDQEILQAQTLVDCGMSAQKEVDRLKSLRDLQAKKHYETLEEWASRVARLMKAWKKE